MSKLGHLSRKSVVIEVGHPHGTFIYCEGQFKIANRTDEPKMGCLRLVDNTKRDWFSEARRYYDTKIQDDQGAEFYVRFTEYEVREAK